MTSLRPQLKVLDEENNMTHESIRIIHDEHAALAAMLQSLRMMVKRGPGTDANSFFDVLRAMLFYIDEFPERLHHTKETELLFPPVAARRRPSPSPWPRRH